MVGRHQNSIGCTTRVDRESTISSHNNIDFIDRYLGQIVSLKLFSNSPVAKLPPPPPYGFFTRPCKNYHGRGRCVHRQTDIYSVERKKIINDLFVIEMRLCTCIYKIVNLLKVI